MGETAPGRFLSPSGYLLSSHPTVHLLAVTVEEVQVQALLILSLARVPQLQQGSPIVGECCHLWKGRGNVPGRYLITQFYPT